MSTMNRFLGRLLAGAALALCLASAQKASAGNATAQAFPLAFGPWVDALRSGRIVFDTEVLGALAPVWRAELTRLLPEVAGDDLPAPSDDHLRLFESVAHLVEKLISARPVVLILEDLHWADEMSLRLLAFLSRRTPALPVALVTTLAYGSRFQSVLAPFRITNL